MTDRPLQLIEVDVAMRPLTQYLALGEDEALIDQLITKSKQAAIMEHTPKDAAERFANRHAFDTWQARGRELHWLLGANNDLAGIIWYGRSTFPVDVDLPEIPEETFAIRIYDGYSGHGLARPFMKLSLKTHVGQKEQRSEPISGIWLQSDADNPAALAAYTKFGYHEVARDDTRVTMMMSSEEILALVKE